MNPAPTRIFSDLHFGDRASALKSLAGLEPLLEGAGSVVFNGDTLDTRPSRDPAGTAALRAEVTAWIARQHVPITAIPGNHDPDISPLHSLELAGGQVFVTHGDGLFEDIVPWSRDAADLRRLLAAELARLVPAARERLDEYLAAVHRAAGQIPQRHQSERHGLKYTLGFLSDTVWPPTRILRILRAWRETPRRADALLRRHELSARYFVMGHTHRLGIMRGASGLVVLNTGSFCPPGGAGFVDVLPDRICLRRIVRRGSEFRCGPALAEFPLAHA